MHVKNIWSKKDISGSYKSKSNKLMVQAGLIHQLGSGMYAILPHGLKAMHKIIDICHQEMQKIGAQEINMPSVLPVSLLHESSRIDIFGPDILYMTDRHGAEVYYAPTHEEPVIKIMQAYLASYKQLPITLYQVQNKFRDELRPRGGLLRSREFTMLDAYSFHTTKDCLLDCYQKTREALQNIFDRMQINYVIVSADTGNIGGDFSEEFQVITPIGEDVLYVSSNHNYAANIECATYDIERYLATGTEEDIKIRHIFLTDIVDRQRCICIFLDNKRNINLLKVNKICQGQFLPIEEMTSAGDRLNIDVFIDYSAIKYIQHFIQEHRDESSSNCINVYMNSQSMIRLEIEKILNAKVIDMTNVIEGDFAVGGGILELKRGVEVGHIFQLGDAYSRKMGLKVGHANNTSKHVLMGCYGIGIARLLAVAIEQFSSEDAIRWPTSINPYDLAIINLDPDLIPLEEELIKRLRNHKIEVFIATSGTVAQSIKDANLIGCENILFLKKGSVTFKKLDHAAETHIYDPSMEQILDFIKQMITSDAL